MKKVEDSGNGNDDSDGETQFVPDSQLYTANCEDSLNVIIHSDDEFPDETEAVNNFTVKNFYTPKHCASNGVKTPSKYVTDLFKPTVCTLDNMVVFVSIGGYVGKHKAKFNSPTRCMLSPICDIKWAAGDSFGRVLVLESPNHPKNVDL